MTQLSSKTPRDLNHDPYGYVCTEGPSCRHSRKLAPTTRWSPRPEFDHVQHNEPNPILVEFRATLRNYNDKALCLAHYIEYVDGAVYGWAPAHIDHARKVFIRLTLHRSS